MCPVSTPSDRTTFVARLTIWSARMDVTATTCSASEDNAAIVLGSTKRPCASDLVRGTEMPSSAITYAPCQVKVCASWTLACAPPDVPALMIATGLR